MAKIRYLNDLDKVDGMPERLKKELAPVTEQYRFRANDYYLSLIDWNDPDDPIRRLVIPNLDELHPWGELDASAEETNYVAPGTQHKYHGTVLLLCNEVCGAYCRFCFRKRIFMDGNDEINADVSAGIDYIRNNPEVTNVLLTGGDPFMLSTRRLEAIVKEIRAIDHVGAIRIGTKMAAFNPYRILDDPTLLEMISRYSRADKRIYVITHFNVENELTEVAIKAIELMQKAGAIVANQTPLLAGINDKPKVLAALFEKLTRVGVPPYYIFQCRPTEGNRPFAVPLVHGLKIVKRAGQVLSGLAKRARYVMSHATGKIEIIGLTKYHIFLKYHRARFFEDDGRFMIFKRNDNAYWLDDLEADDDIDDALPHWDKQTA